MGITPYEMSTPSSSIKVLAFLALCQLITLSLTVGFSDQSGLLFGTSLTACFCFGFTGFAILKPGKVILQLWRAVFAVFLGLAIGQVLELLLWSGCIRFDLMAAISIVFVCYWPTWICRFIFAPTPVNQSLNHSDRHLGRLPSLLSLGMLQGIYVLALVSYSRGEFTSYQNLILVSLVVFYLARMLELAYPTTNVFQGVWKFSFLAFLVTNLAAIEATHLPWKWDRLLLEHISLFWPTLVLCFLPRRRPLGLPAVVTP